MLLVAELDIQNQDVNEVLGRIENALGSSGSVIESQVTADRSQLFSVIEADSKEVVGSGLGNAGLKVLDLAQVRLVGAELADIKKLKPKGQYLVEWDFPEGLTMDKYLTRKKEKSPLYEGITDAKFLRTYVREDMVKCLCFYDGDSEEAVLNARKVVDTPVSRIHQIQGVENTR